jgi:outer membrane protein assembly factor BamB
MTLKWDVDMNGAIYSSAAIGDVDGDGALEIVVGSNDGKVYCLDSSGSRKWTFQTQGPVYSSPSLAMRRSFGIYGNEWPMFRANPSRTGLYGGPTGWSLSVYVGSEDEYLYVINGKYGSLVDRFQVRHNDSHLWFRGVHTSAAVADVDGDLKLEFFFTDWGNTSTKGGHTFWAIEDVDSDGTVTAAIDIMPGVVPNCFNNDGRGVIPVAVLGSNILDVTQIDTSMLLFDGLHVRMVGRGSRRRLLCSVDDVSGDFTTDPNGIPDGYLDLVCQFEDEPDIWTGADSTARLEGRLYNGTPIEGEDSICLRP